MECRPLLSADGHVVGFACGPAVGPAVGRNKCSCGRWSVKLCDGPAPADSGRTTCDVPLCGSCTFHVPGKDLDYCTEHRQLAVGGKS